MDKGKSTDALIEDLASKLSPVSVLARPVLRWTLWFIISFVSVLALMIFIQPFRDKVFFDLMQPYFLVETFLALASAFSCSYLAYALAIPGNKVTSSQVFLSILPLFGFLGFTFYGTTSGEGFQTAAMAKRPTCVKEVLALSWLPIFFMTYQLRKAYPFFSKKIGFLMGISGAVIPMSLMQMACFYSPKHNLTAHFGPVLLIVVLTVLLSPLLFYKKTS